MSDEVTIREFTRQAASFEEPGSHFADLDVLDWIAAHVGVGPEDRVLDVAGGTGQLGRHLGRSAGLTVVADLTPAMLEQGVAATQAAGRRDVVFVRADAAALPFADAQFEVVVSRFALHHLPDIDAALREMRRVCVTGGTVTVIDMVAGPGPVGDRLDELERLRDPSHGACPREGHLRELLDGAGLRLDGVAERDESLPAEPWLDRAQPTADAHDAVLAALRDEAAGGRETGLRAGIVDGVLTVTHRYVLMGSTASPEA
jgi:SAM-dependent methyltransferase